MDLKSFVSESLAQIVEGIADAQKRIAEMKTNAAVNPSFVGSDAKRKIGRSSPVEFDVAVTVANDRKSSVSATGTVGFLSVVSAKLSARGEAAESARDEAISRIKFSVELAQPADIEEYRYDPGGGGNWKTV